MNIESILNPTGLGLIGVAVLLITYLILNASVLASYRTKLGLCPSGKDKWDKWRIAVDEKAPETAKAEAREKDKIISQAQTWELVTHAVLVLCIICAITAVVSSVLAM